MVSRFLKISVWISLLFTLSVFSQGLKHFGVFVEKNLYGLVFEFDRPPRVRVFKDTKRELLVLKLNRSVEISRNLYSVFVKGEGKVLTVLIKNPKLNLAGAKVEVKNRRLLVLIPFGKHSSKYVVVIDPGHGGKDSGAIYFGVKEKDINLAIAKKLYDLLKKDGRFKVYLTRRGDYYVSLKERQIFTAKVGADLFLSIHANASPHNPNARGVSFFVLSDKGKFQKLKEIKEHSRCAENFFPHAIAKNKTLRSRLAETTLEITQDGGERLAEILCRIWSKRLGRLIPCWGIYKRAFAVLKVPGVPTVLVEVGFMSNRRELKLLVNPRVQREIAETLYRGILDYFRY